MNKDDIGVFLHEVPLFADLRPETLQEIGTSSQIKRFQPNDVISYESSSNALYVILSGNRRGGVKDRCLLSGHAVSKIM